MRATFFESMSQDEDAPRESCLRFRRSGAGRVKLCHLLSCFFFSSLVSFSFLVVRVAFCRRRVAAGHEPGRRTRSGALTISLAARFLFRFFFVMPRTQGYFLRLEMVSSLG